MKINDIYSNRNDINYMNKVDFSNNDSFGLPLQRPQQIQTDGKQDDIQRFRQV